ncbi:MAG: hypothetical protein KIT84_22415 [Labilithrix sp.]|nr:hypothetical protein [Labilithrix sp.]MCW5813799.1 hypothetical protein [Labilithrix sp.]
MAVLQAGPPGFPAHWLSLVHGTHVPLVPQIGVEPAHALVFDAVHTRHWPEATSHAEPDGFPAHCVSLVQGTHEPLALQTGLPAPQRAVFPGAHSTQSPVAPQTGSVELVLVQYESPPASWHPRQTPSAEQLGVAPAHALALLGEHGLHAPFKQTPPAGFVAQSASFAQGRHVPLLSSQTGIAAVHAAGFVAEQTLHRP